VELVRLPNACIPVINSKYIVMLKCTESLIITLMSRILYICNLTEIKLEILHFVTEYHS
jgi:hypothetical protein